MDLTDPTVLRECYGRSGATRIAQSIEAVQAALAEVERRLDRLLQDFPEYRRPGSELRDGLADLIQDCGLGALAAAAADAVDGAAPTPEHDRAWHHRRLL